MRMKIDPDAAGMDAGRLRRIDEHLGGRYVEPGKIAGCQVLVARHGAVAHLASLGQRDPDGERRLVDPQRPMTVRDLMMHMSGLGYAIDNSDLSVDMLRKPIAARFGEGATLATMVDRLAEVPLRFHPGTHWLYSWSTDVCGRLVEVLSGQRFDDYLRTTIFEPLGMADTGFTVP